MPQHTTGQHTAAPQAIKLINMPLKSLISFSFKITCMLFQNLKSMLEMDNLAKSSLDHKNPLTAWSHALIGRARQPTASKCLNCIWNAQHNKHPSQPNTGPQCPNNNASYVPTTKTILRHCSAKHGPSWTKGQPRAIARQTKSTLDQSLIS